MRLNVPEIIMLYFVLSVCLDNSPDAVFDKHQDFLNAEYQA